ncbi:uncharacterized protein LOC104884875 [Beta vulgaris subsp. vulgaris]|uniref:uncharacterized protein LOC104884875 n=1 Tax=Beta vulgaris subsp. vulgaris TaxID=3555 RepID=UPI002549B564|nr:uncharacterized protein LOC104884875 [Beta vulgaris subsp. vulgaris]
MYLCIEPFATTTAISTLVDYNTITIMPKYVAIKGVNDKYLSLNDEVALTFMSDDLGEEGNAYEIHSSSDGHVFLEPAFVPRKHGFWRAEEGGSVMSRAPHSGSEDPTDPTMLFSVIKISKNVIALRCVGNNRICRLFQYEGSTWADLQATATGLIKEVQLQVIEPVVERRVNFSNSIWTELESMTAYRSHILKDKPTIQPTLSKSSPSTLPIQKLELLLGILANLGL